MHDCHHPMQRIVNVEVAQKTRLMQNPTHWMSIEKTIYWRYVKYGRYNYDHIWAAPCDHCLPYSAGAPFSLRMCESTRKPSGSHGPQPIHLLFLSVRRGSPSGLLYASGEAGFRRG